MPGHAGNASTNGVQDTIRAQAPSEASAETPHIRSNPVSSQTTHADQPGPMSGSRCLDHANNEHSDGHMDMSGLNLGTIDRKQHVNVGHKPRIPSRSFRFLDLPPELRIMIYRELLTTKGRQMAVRDRFAQFIGPCNLTARLVRSDQREWDGGIRPDCKVLFVNRQINAEAAFELYSCNTWCFERSLHLSRWLQSISPEARKALRAVDFDHGAVSRHERTIAHLLSESTYLRSLTIGPFTEFGRRRIAMYAPLWRALYARVGSVDGVIKCVKIRTTCRHCQERAHHGIRCIHKFGGFRPSFVSDIRAELTRLLIDEPAELASREIVAEVMGDGLKEDEAGLIL